MLTTLQCNQCGVRFDVDAGKAGSDIECPECRASLAVPRWKLGPGTTVGGFRIEESLGRGGMGEVYLARQLSMDRDVALKILPVELTRDENLVRRFLHEVRMAARLEHPHVVRAYEAGEDSGVHYLAMSYVKGKTLADLLARCGALEEKNALIITRQIGSALAYAWDKYEMLHRDIKPANIMLAENGAAKLTDMGLSKCLHDQAGLTVSGTLLGTPNYMSPEQGDCSVDIDFRSDIYSLGLTLYHMVTGKVPFEDSSMLGVLRKQATESLPDPRESNPDVTEGCVQLLETMLAKAPGKRHSCWEALVADVDRVLKGGMPTVVSPPAGQSVLVRRWPDDAAKTRVTGPRKSVVLGKSTVRKLHEREKARHKPARPSPKTRSKMPAIAAVATVLLAAGIVTGIAVSRSRERSAPRAWRSAQMPKGGQPSAVARQPAMPEPTFLGKTVDPRLAVLREKVEKAFARVLEFRGDYLSGYRAFAVLRPLVKGTELEQIVAEEFFRLDELLYEQSTGWSSQGCMPAWVGEVGSGKAAYGSSGGGVLPVTKATLDAALTKLRSANPGNISWRTARIEPNGIVLDLSRQTTLTDVSALKGLPVKSLNLRGTAVADLSVLDDMPLEHLDLWNAAAAQKNLSTLPQLPLLRWLNIGGGYQPTVSNLEPLRGLPLEYLNLLVAKHDPHLTDLSPLKGMPLKTLLMNCRSDLVDLSPLRGMPLSVLNLRECSACEDLSPLGEMPLKVLTLTGCKRITDLSPLEGAPLEDLSLTKCRGVRDLSSLEGMPLKNLAIGGTAVQDLAPVADIKDLRIVYGDRQDLQGSKPSSTGSTATAGNSPTNPTETAAPASATPGEENDPKMEALRKEFEAALAYAKEHDTDYSRCYKNFAGLLNRARGTELEQSVAKAFAAWDELLYRHSFYMDPRENPLGSREGGNTASPPGRTVAAVTQQTLDAALEKLRSANPGGVTWKTARIDPDGVVLDFTNQAVLKDISALKGLPIKSLNLRGTGVADLSPLANMPLERLDLWGATAAQANLATLPRLPLRWLHLGGGVWPVVTDLEPLRGLPLECLNMLAVNANPRINDLSPLEGMPLRTLVLNQCRDLSELSPLAGMPLTQLDLSSNRALKELSPLRGIPLVRLNLSSSRSLSDLTPLQGLPLKELNICRCPNITDISALKGMPLEKLNISGTGVRDYTPVADCPTLKVFCR